MWPREPVGQRHRARQTTSSRGHPRVYALLQLSDIMIEYLLVTHQFKPMPPRGQLGGNNKMSGNPVRDRSKARSQHLVLDWRTFVHDPASLRPVRVTLRGYTIVIECSTPLCELRIGTILQQIRYKAGVSSRRVVVCGNQIYVELGVNLPLAELHSRAQLVRQYIRPSARFDGIASIYEDRCRCPRPHGTGTFTTITFELNAPIDPAKVMSTLERIKLVGGVHLATITADGENIGLSLTPTYSADLELAHGVMAEVAAEARIKIVGTEVVCYRPLRLAALLVIFE